MNLNDELSVLRSIPLFSGIKPEALKLLAFASDRMIFQSGQPLFREGDQSAAAYVILSGMASIHHHDGASEQHIGDVLPPMLVGEVALFCDKPRQVSVTASSTVEALLISKDSFQKLMAACPKTMSNILSQLGEQLSRAS